MPHIIHLDMTKYSNINNNTPHFQRRLAMAQTHQLSLLSDNNNLNDLVSPYSLNATIAANNDNERTEIVLTRGAFDNNVNNNDDINDASTTSNTHLFLNDQYGINEGAVLSCS